MQIRDTGAQRICEPSVPIRLFGCQHIHEPGHDPGGPLQHLQEHFLRFQKAGTSLSCGIVNSTERTALEERGKWKIWEDMAEPMHLIAGRHPLLQLALRLLVGLGLDVPKQLCWGTGQNSYLSAHVYQCRLLTQLIHSNMAAFTVFEEELFCGRVGKGLLDADGPGVQGKEN